jgi:hypothetical protein
VGSNPTPAACSSEKGPVCSASGTRVPWIALGCVVPLETANDRSDLAPTGAKLARSYSLFSVPLSSRRHRRQRRPPVGRGRKRGVRGSRRAGVVGRSLAGSRDLPLHAAPQAAHRGQREHRYGRDQGPHRKRHWRTRSGCRLCSRRRRPVLFWLATTNRDASTRRLGDPRNAAQDELEGNSSHRVVPRFPRASPCLGRERQTPRLAEATLACPPADRAAEGRGSGLPEVLPRCRGPERPPAPPLRADRLTLAPTQLPRAPTPHGEPLPAAPR